MQMVRALDAGPVILALRTPIESDETAGELQLRLAELGAEALIEALILLGVGRATLTPQDDARATYATKIVRDDARLPFSAPSDQVARLVRASFLSLREREFTEAARAIGSSDARIIFRHLLPNAIAPIIVGLPAGETPPVPRKPPEILGWK